MTATAWQTCLTWQAARHPSMTPWDAVKLCYQAAYGPEHLLRNTTTARAALQAELDSLPQASMPPEAARAVLYEPVGDGYGRVNLSAWQALGLPPEWLFRLFAAAAREDRPDPELDARLDAVSLLARKGDLPFSWEAWQTCLADYREAGGGPVHHSQTYRDREHPAYRLISSRDRALLELLPPLAGLNPATHAVIALEGRAAAGKTTLAARLALLTDAAVVHMDDFFLPPEQQTPQRLAQPGGNVDYTRFAAQVLPRLRTGEALSYPRYDCSTKEYEGVTVPAARWHIVEGAYSCHPAFGQYADLVFFCDVSPALQAQRILARNGPELARVFQTRWIPLEEAYLTACQVRERAQAVYSSEG